MGGSDNGGSCFPFPFVVRLITEEQGEACVMDELGDLQGAASVVEL
jgi:hypothetical protein